MLSSDTFAGLQLTPAQAHYARRSAPLDPSARRDGTRAPGAKRATKNLRAARAFKSTLRAGI